MKKHCYNSLSDFYADVKNVVKAPMFDYYNRYEQKSWIGLSNDEIKQSLYSYSVGVEKLSHFSEVKVEKDIRIKYWNQFDGFDIDVDRMYDNLDFLLDTRRQRKLPKTIDIYVNIIESWKIGYNQMLIKAYAALSIIDKLETLGVRCAVYACSAFNPKVGKNKFLPTEYLEVCIKNYHDPVNIGALCTAISPWMFRHHMILWTIGHIPNIDLNGVSQPERLPSGLTGIIIEKRQCLDLNEANQFIQNIKVA